MRRVARCIIEGAQHALIEDAARQSGLPSAATVSKIADLENTIAAVLALIEERKGPGELV